MIPKKTMFLALKKRQSLRMPDMPHERLAIQKMQSEQKKVQMREDRDLQESLLSPFKPQISPLKNRLGPLTARHREKQSKFPNQWEFLHVDGLKKSKTFKTDKTLDDVLLEREQQEYTFKPDTSKKGAASLSPTKF
mmetsp:Transcript_5313/g.8950  ORF Transcript_5313/g.8950 Transcript_5313/m.8950 type:complete len:136 (+) Transcript_5313:1628-2035(+)